MYKNNNNNNVCAFKRLFVTLAAAICCLFAFSVSVNAANASDFTDVPKNCWYYSYLEFATENNMVYGTSDTTFSPDMGMSRAQFITLFGRAFGSQYPVEEKFEDVDSGSYYAPYVYWGVENGIISGTSATTFSPNVLISRQDMATIVGRYLTSYGIELPASDKAPEYFNDASAISTYAAYHLDALRNAGILLGDTNGNANPRNTMTRAEGVTILVRLVQAIELVKNTTNVPDNETDFDDIPVLGPSQTESEETDASDATENTEDIVDDSNAASPVVPRPANEAELIAQVAEEMTYCSGMTSRLVISEKYIDIALFRVPDAGMAVYASLEDIDGYSINFGDNAVDFIDSDCFRAVTEVTPDTTIAHVIDGTSLKIYICRETGEGRITDQDLLDCNGNSLISGRENDLCFFIRNDNCDTITYAVWEQIG